MERRRYNRRRRRGRLSFLWKLIAAVVIVAAMIAAITLFFRMDHIAVSGMVRYSEQDVLEASGLELGTNLYYINKYEVKERIFTQLPYVEEVRINRKLPDTMLIEIRECKAVAGIEFAGNVWLISEHGKLLEKAETVPAGCPLIAGGLLVSPEVSAQAAFVEEQSYRADVVLTLLREAEQRGMRGKIPRIDLSDDTALTMDYLGRFTVRFPWTAEVGYKLDSLATAISYLEDNETGRINLMTDGKVSFIPE